MAEFAGSLRETLAVEQWIAAPDDSGGDAGAWAAAGTARAALVPVESNALTVPVVGERVTGRARFRVTVRPRIDLGLTSRLRWRGRVLAVVRVEPDPRTPDRLTLLVEDRT